MSTGNIVNIEFLNHNALRSYPLLDGTSKKDTTNSFEIPNNFIVDFSLTVHEDIDIDPGLFYIANIATFTLGIVITLGYDTQTIASISVSKAGHTLNKTYYFSGEGIFSDSRGKITIGSLADINNLPAGSWTFTINNTRLLPTVIKPSLRGVQSLAFSNNNEVSNPFVGSIQFKAGANIRFDTDSINNTVTINAIEGEGLNVGCDCNGTIGPPIRSINGISADESGNFYITGSECVDIQNAVNRPNSILIEDVCSSPCCGCAELEVVTDALKNIQNSELTLREFLNRIENSMSMLETALVASKTANITCP